MSKLIVEKSPPLSGCVMVSGAKNAALPLMAAALLTDETVVIENIPYLMDIENMAAILTYLGRCCNRTKNIITLQNDHTLRLDTPYDLACRLRASFLVMGPLLARFGRTKICYPGGCAIGSRPVDLHLKGFAALGAEITQGHGFVEASASQLTGAKIYLDYPSVGASENIIMAAALAHGETILENAATEPEIVELSNFLNKMGADIHGAGTNRIRIVGVDSLHGVTYSVMPDRIEAGTFMAAAAITGGCISVNQVVPEHLKPISAKMREMGIIVNETNDTIFVNASKGLKGADIKTMPFPGFPTDMQAQFSSLLSVAEGTSMIIETVFENRFMHVGELCRMGAHIKIDGRSEVIEGCRALTGAPVKATDLRAGAGLVIAALAAQGKTEISDVYHIDRGYEHFEEKLSALGARLTRVK